MMNDDLILASLAANATKRAFEDVAGVWFDSVGEQFVSALRSRIPRIVAEASGMFAVEFASVLLKALLGSEDSLNRIERDISKLVREPVRTALEQFRVGAALRPTDPDGQSHREHRFHDCLTNLDRALSLAEDRDVPMINLLRGICALQIRGAGCEARDHLHAFVQACQARAARLQEMAIGHIESAARNEEEAKTIEVPRGVGVGGGLIGMGVAEPRIRKASLLYAAGLERKQAEELMGVADELSTASVYANALAEIATKRA